MRTNRGAAAPVCRLRHAGGFSLVETIVAVAVSLIVGLAIYTVFNSMQRGGQAQKLYNDTQTGCSFAMEQLKGELLRAGYRAPKYKKLVPGDIVAGVNVCVANPNDSRCLEMTRAISNATQGGSSVTLEYYDDNAREVDTSTYTNATEVTYELSVNNQLIRKFKNFDPVAKKYNSAERTQVVGSNITALSFSYFTGNDTLWNGVDPLDIRTIRPTLECRSAQRDPNKKGVADPTNPDDPKWYQYVTLTTEVRARNIGVDSVSVDNTPPGTPAGVVTWDPGQCGTLNVRWNANTEADLAGYVLFYGPTSSDFTTRQTVARAPGASGAYEYLTVVNQDTLTLGSTYYFAVESYDKSGNLSPLSAVASGNPSPSIRSATTGSSDSTVNLLAPPAAPTGFTATPGLNAVTLTWTRSPAVGLRGYKLFRSESTADFTLIDDIPDAGGNRIKTYPSSATDTTGLGPDTVSFVDTGLQGCKNYFYKLVAIDCDTAITTTNMIAALVTGVATDNTRPPAPIITARPGYRRVILTLTNPVRTGPDNPMKAADFSYTKIYWSKTGVPVLNDATGVVTPNTAIPRYLDVPLMPNLPSPPDGTFTGEANSMGTISFNDETSATTTAPNLTPDATYFFRAVTYDLCGLSSTDTTSSVAEGTQCGDCLLPGGAHDPVCYDSAGLTVANLAKSGCYGYVDLSWDPINDSVVRDLQGFRVQRREGASWVGGTAEVSLTGSDAAWLTSFRDATAQPGISYSYRVMATDCYYEQHNGKPAAQWPEAGNDPSNNYSDSFANDVAIGELRLDPTLPDLVSGYLLPESSAARTALPGSLPAIAPHFTISPADVGLTSVPPTFQHNTVTMWVNNSAKSNLTLAQAQLTWANPLAYLQQISFGDGLTTPTTRLGWRDPAAMKSSGETVTLAANSRLLALDDKIPVVALFKKADGSVDKDVDSRQQTLSYTLTYRNDSTATDGCTMVGNSYYVPLGPYVYGTSQDQPADGTRAWAVPGDLGTNVTDTVTASSATAVNVFTNIFDSSNAGIAAGAVKLYYAVTDALTAAPSLTGAAEYPNLPPYTAITMVRVSSTGSQWRTPVGNGIPASPGKSIWYFIVAVDNQGNFDREPEIDSGVFQYYQQQANVCATIPNAPASFTGSTGADSVTLSWTRPDKNTDTSNYLDDKGYKIYRRQDAGAWLYLATINDKLTLTYTDSVGPAIETSVFDYRATAFDLCTPTANEGAPSAIYTETAEGPCGNTPSAPVLGGSTGGSGSSVTLTWTRPTLNTSGSTITDLAGYRIWKRVDTGAWALIGTTSAGDETYPDSGLVDAGYRDHSYYVTAYDSCSDPAANVSVASNVYVDSFTANPCDTTPNMPSNFRFVFINSTTGVDLAWDAPTTQSNPAGWPFNDPGGYLVFRGDWDGSSYTNGVWLPTTSGIPATPTSYRDSTAAAAVGTTVYAYWVQTFDSCAARQLSGWLGPIIESYTWVDPCADPPGPPTGPLTTTPADSSGVRLTWSPPNPLPSDFAGYVIERKTGTLGTFLPIVNTSPAGGSPLLGGATTIKDIVFTAGNNAYFYRVQTIDTCPLPTGPLGSSYIEAGEAYDYCTSLMPDGPTGLAVTATDATGVTLSWAAPSPLPDDFGGYEIERGVGTDSAAPATWAPIAGSPQWGSATTIKDSFTTAGTAVYYYRVRAFDLCTADRKYSGYTTPVKEVFTYDPCGSLPAPTQPTVVNWRLLSGSSNNCRNNSNSPVAVKAELYWTATAALPGGVTSRSYEIFACNTASCTPATATTFTAPANGSGSNVNEWTTTVTPGGFLASAPYTFGVQQVYTNGTCSKRSTMATVTETCN